LSSDMSHPVYMEEGKPSYSGSFDKLRMTF